MVKIALTISRVLAVDETLLTFAVMAQTVGPLGLAVLFNMDMYWWRYCRYWVLVVSWQKKV